MRISVLKCYALAWKSFTKWWIPLCAVSGAIFVFNLLPQILAAPEIRQLGAVLSDAIDAMLEQDLDALADASERMGRQGGQLAASAGTYTLYVLPAIAVLTTVLLMVASRAVRDRRRRDTRPLWVAYVALVHVVIVLVEGGVAIVLLLLPGVALLVRALLTLAWLVPVAYLYIRLVFVYLVMLEHKKGALAALAESWRMTRGNFWRLVLLILMNAAVQSAASGTIIGIIPATGFANTARAAAFWMLLNPPPPPAG